MICCCYETHSPSSTIRLASNAPPISFNNNNNNKKIWKKNGNSESKQQIIYVCTTYRSQIDCSNAVDSGVVVRRVVNDCNIIGRRDCSGIFSYSRQRVGGVVDNIGVIVIVVIVIVIVVIGIVVIIIVEFCHGFLIGVLFEL